MPKFLLRIVALLLVPCLVADPLMVFAFSSPDCVATMTPCGFNRRAFAEEAITGFLIQGWTRLARWKFRQSMDLRQEEVVASRQSDQPAAAPSTVPSTPRPVDKPLAHGLGAAG